jgi:hypothetical protein
VKDKVISGKGSMYNSYNQKISITGKGLDNYLITLINNLSKKTEIQINELNQEITSVTSELIVFFKIVLLLIINYTKDAVVKAHTQNTDIYLSTMVTNIIYVDNKRTDTYTETGSLTKPFKTVQAANDSIVGSSSTNRFVIKVSTGLHYPEAIALTKDFTTIEGYGETILSGSINITSPHIRFSNIKIIGPVTLNLANHFLLEAVNCSTGPGVWNITATAPVGDEWLQLSGDVAIWKASINATGITGVSSIAGGYFEGVQTYTNCWVELMGFETWGTINLEAGTEATIGAVLPINATINLKTGAILNADATVLGSGLTLNNTGGTLNLLTKANRIANVPAGTIVATNVQDAINALDNTKPTLSSGIIAPVSTPSKIGDIYIDTLAKKMYFAAGTSSSADWIIV